MIFFFLKKKNVNGHSSSSALGKGAGGTAHTPCSTLITCSLQHRVGGSTYSHGLLMFPDRNLLRLTSNSVHFVHEEVAA